jgi:PEGA domain
MHASKPARAFPACPPWRAWPDILILRGICVGVAARHREGKRFAGLRQSGRAASGLCRVAWFAAAALILLFAGTGVAWAQSTAEYGGATATMGAVGTGVRPTDILTTPSAANPNDITLPARSGPPPDAVNRRAFEKQAGSVAAKLLLRSAPGNARVWLDGKFVGRTPLLLLVPPGAYRVLMLGDRQEHAEERISLLAHETRDVELRLAERYPTTIGLTGLQ